MNLYDEQISRVLGLLKGEKGRLLETGGANWEDADQQNLVLRSEMAFELGGGGQPAVSFLGITSSEALVASDQACLYGEELSQIPADTAYARITLLRVDKEKIGKGEILYDDICRFVRTRYQVNPKGFMSRISTRSTHEPVRVSKTALESGLSFAKVAGSFLEAYKKHPEVLAVQVIFVTLPNFNYSELLRLSQKNDQITAALDHLLRDMTMDCSSCKLQALCGEVEGMKEMHFA